MVDCLCDQQDPTGSSPGFSGDSAAGSAGPADNQPWIPLPYTVHKKAI